MTAILRASLATWNSISATSRASPFRSHSILQKDQPFAGSSWPIAARKAVNCGLEDVTVEGLKTAQLFIANACAYKHVVLRGKLGDIKICRSVPWASAPAGYLPRKQEAMDRANAEYYKSVDWALDISQAEFTSGEVEGIPPELVRRDPATQFVLRAKAIKDGRWREVDLSGTYWSPLLDAYAKEGMGDVVLIAPKAASDFKALLKGLMALREAGVLEPD
jgi:hypothetical protein